jgi:NitT/TauT family transport system substrate-binding protein
MAISACCAVLVLVAPCAAAELRHGKLRAVVLEGTGALEAETIKAYGLDLKYGFELEYTAVLSPPTLYTAVNTRNTDFAHGAWSTMARFRTQGTDVVMVAAITKMNHDLLVPVASAIRGFADLKGKRIGLFGGPAGGSTVTLRILLQRFYHTELYKDVSVHFAAEPNLFALAERGDLDVVAALDPNATKQLLTGRFRSIGSLGDEWERRFGYPNTSSVLVTYGSLVRSRPLAVQAMVNAWRDSRQHLMSDASLPDWRRYCRKTGISGEG